MLPTSEGKRGGHFVRDVVAALGAATTFVFVEKPDAHHAHLVGTEKLKRKLKVAISNILPRKTMQNRTPVQSMSARLDYDQKEEKTRGGELVSSYMCSPDAFCQGEFQIIFPFNSKNQGVTAFRLSTP